VPGKADFNLYAYVSGAVLKSVDPVGLDSEPKGFWGKTLSAIGCGLLLGCGNANAPSEADVKYGRVEPQQTKNEFTGEFAMAVTPVPRGFRFATRWVEARIGPLATRQLERLGVYMGDRFAIRIARQLVKIESVREGLADHLKAFAAREGLPDSTRIALNRAANATRDHLTSNDLSAVVAEVTGTPLMTNTTKTHVGEVADALRSLGDAAAAIQRKITHEERRLGSGALDASEKAATEKFVDGLKETRTMVVEHKDAVQRVIGDAEDAAKPK
jgi:hypothetical protein